MSLFLILTFVNYSKILLHVYIRSFEYIQSHYQVFKEQLLYKTINKLRNRLMFIAKLNDLSKLSKITFKMFCRKVLRSDLCFNI